VFEALDRSGSHGLAEQIRQAGERPGVDFGLVPQAVNSVQPPHQQRYLLLQSLQAEADRDTVDLSLGVNRGEPGRAASRGSATALS